jgi:DNA transformation protein
LDFGNSQAVQVSDPLPLSMTPNLGPKSAEILARAGLTTLAQLQAVGAVAAYVRAKRTGANVSLNLLWALEGAVSGLRWQEVARVHRTSLLLALDEYEHRAIHNTIPGKGGVARPPELPIGKARTVKSRR